MAAKDSGVIAAMKEDLKEEFRVLRVKRRVVKILEQLPDDDARRRVMGAVAALSGYDVVGLTSRRLR